MSPDTLDAPPAAAAPEIPRLDPKAIQRAKRRDRSDVTRYAALVATGTIVACQTVILACERHLRDLLEARERGYVFDPNRAEHLRRFFRDYLVLPNGRPFELLPWSYFVLGCLFGWVEASTRRRRFREAYIETGKGSGKTPKAAGVGLYGLVGDGEVDPEIFTAAPILDQAARVWRAAMRMVKANPTLGRRIGIHESSLTLSAGDAGYLKATTGDSDTKDGPIVHMAIVDELHEHKDGATIDKLRLGFKGRRQPLLLQITNAGETTDCICWEQREKTILTLKGQMQNDQLFGYIAGVDPDDKPLEDETCWIKANPSLGAGGGLPDKRYIREAIAGATSPQATQRLKRLLFGVWSRAASPAFNMPAWDRGQSEWATSELDGQPCWIGVDLASRLDLASITAIFPRTPPEPETPADVDPDVHRIAQQAGRLARALTGQTPEAHAGAGAEWWRVLSHSFTPEPTFDDLEDFVRQPLSRWVTAGHLTVCETDTIDYDQVADMLVDWSRRYQLVRLGYDRANIGNLIQILQRRAYLRDDQCVEVRQTLMHLTWAAKTVQADVRGGRIDAGRNPLLRWQATNTVYKADSNLNVRPVKDATPSGRGKIDAIVALIIAREVARLDENKPPPPPRISTLGADPDRARAGQPAAPPPARETQRDPEDDLDYSEPEPLDDYYDDDDDDPWPD